MLSVFRSTFGSESVAGGQAVVYICISIGLTLLAGLMSGLTLGLMSMDHVDLEVSRTAFDTCCTMLATGDGSKKGRCRS